MPMSYQNYLHEHAQLSGQVDAWEQRREVAAGAYDRASEEFNAKFATASYEEKDQLLEKLGNTGEALADATKNLQGAKNQLEHLELDNPKLEAARQEDLAVAPGGKLPDPGPEKSFKEKAANVVEKVVDTAMLAGAVMDVTGAALNPDLPMSNPTPRYENSKPIDFDKKTADLAPGGPRELREKAEQQLADGDRLNEAYANAKAGSPPEPAPEPKPPLEPMSIEIQGSATFGKPEFGTYPISNERIAQDFAAPLPPPPPPPSPEPEPKLVL